MDKIKVAIVGTGTISNHHIQSYLKNPNVELYAFCDLDEAKVKMMAEKYGVTRTYTDEETMLKELPEIDAVSVCVWNSAHMPCTVMALNYGKHVLCEKPMATSAEEGRIMKEAADKAGKLLMIGFVRRHGNDTAIFKDFQEQDYFGDIYWAKAQYIRRNGNPGGWFGEKARSGGGPLIDLGVHVIDLTRYMLGNPKPVSVYGATFQKLFDRRNLKTPKAYVSSSHTDHDICDVEDAATAMIRYDNGAVVQVEVSFSLNVEKESGVIELFGTKGGAKIDPELKLISEANGYMTDTTLKARTAMDMNVIFQNEINHFVDCITKGIPCKAPAEDGIILMEILDAIFESARTGHEVQLG